MGMCGCQPDRHVADDGRNHFRPLYAASAMVKGSSAPVERMPSPEIEHLRAQVDGTKAGRDFHIDTAAALLALLTNIIDAEKEFRDGMGENWEGDPLSDAIDAARRFINLETPAPVIKGER